MYGEFMSFKDTQSYKELQADWRWIHSLDPEVAAAADQWVKEHPEEWKDLEHMLYYSEVNFHKHVAPDTLEDAEMKQPGSYNPEAFLPEEVCNAIYDDRRWLDRAKYLPEGSDEDSLMYVSKELAECLSLVPPWLRYVGCAIADIFLALMFWRYRNKEVESLLRNHWGGLNGVRSKGYSV